MADKPTVLVGRKLPEAVEARLKRDYDAILNPDDKLYTSEELIELSGKADVILPCHSEHFTADVIEKLSDRVKVKMLCLSDNIADSTYPLRAAEGPKPEPCDQACELFHGGRLAAIQRLVNKAGIYSTLYGEDATQKQALEQGARPASLDADVGIVAAPGSPAGVPAPLEIAAASPVSATWLKSFRIPPSGTRPASLRFLPCHLDDDGRWYLV